jgi:hypothetical protein
MQAVLAQRWAEQLRDGGVAVHAAHPGWANTPGIRLGLPKFRALTQPLLRTPDQGADTLVWVAAAGLPGESTGRLWHDRAQRPGTTPPAPGSPPPSDRPSGSAASD